MNKVREAEIKGKDAEVGKARKMTKGQYVSAQPASVQPKRTKIGVKSEPDAQAAYKPPPPLVVRD